jgi:hypothetical protein
MGICKDKEDIMLKKGTKNNNQYAGTPKAKKFYTAAQVHELIKKRAYEIYRGRGNRPGDQTSDWVAAEKQIRNELGL